MHGLWALMSIVLPRVSVTGQLYAAHSCLSLERELLPCLLNSLQTPLALRLLTQTSLPPLLHIFPCRITWMISLIIKISPEDRLQLSKWGTELPFQPRAQYQCFCPSYTNTHLWQDSIANLSSHACPAKCPLNQRVS